MVDAFAPSCSSRDCSSCWSSDKGDDADEADDEIEFRISGGSTLLEVCDLFGFLTVST